MEKVWRCAGVGRTFLRAYSRDPTLILSVYARAAARSSRYFRESADPSISPIAWFFGTNYFMRVSDVADAFAHLPIAPELWPF